MNREQTFMQILNEYITLKNCLETEKNLFFTRHLLGKLEGIEYCMSEFGYNFDFKNGKWTMNRKLS